MPGTPNALPSTTFAVLRPTPGRVTRSASRRGHLAVEPLDEVGAELHQRRRSWRGRSRSAGPAPRAPRGRRRRSRPRSRVPREERRRDEVDPHVGGLRGQDGRDEQLERGAEVELAVRVGVGSCEDAVHPAGPARARDRRLVGRRHPRRSGGPARGGEEVAGGGAAARCQPTGAVSRVAHGDGWVHSGTLTAWITRWCVSAPLFAALDDEAGDALLAVDERRPDASAATSSSTRATRATRSTSSARARSSSAGPVLGRSREPRSPSSVPGEMFGELSLFDPGPRTATATAVAETQLMALSPRRPDRAARAAGPRSPGAARRAGPAAAHAPTSSSPTWSSPTSPAGSPRRCSTSPHRFGRPADDGIIVAPRPHPGGARPAGRRLPRDGQQGAGRLRHPRLAQARGPRGRPAHGRRAPPASRALGRPLPTPTAAAHPGPPGSRRPRTSRARRCSGVNTRPPLRRATASTNRARPGSSPSMKKLSGRAVPGHRVDLADAWPAPSPGVVGHWNTAVPSARRWAVGSPSVTTRTTGSASGCRRRCRPASMQRVLQVGALDPLRLDLGQLHRRQRPRVAGRTR